MEPEKFLDVEALAQLSSRTLISYFLAELKKTCLCEHHDDVNSCSYKIESNRIVNKVVITTYNEKVYLLSVIIC